MNKRILVVTDNKILAEKFYSLLKQNNFYGSLFTFVTSPKSDPNDFKIHGIKKFDIKDNENIENIINNFDLVISLHCKQLFPQTLSKNVRCINVHPGYNPINRGWYPQVFSIVNNLPIGVTLHEIDEQLDHGNIIIREYVERYIWDTSKDIYDRIIEKEIEILEKEITTLINGKYKTKPIENEGNLFLKSDFNKLCKLDVDKHSSFFEFYNLLRALTHGEHKNAYFIDEKTGKKIFVSLNISVE